MSEICGRWKWICEVERRRRGHCTSLLEGSNRKDSLRECLREWNLEFDILLIFLLVSIYSFVFNQICTYNQNDSIEFVRLEELKEPRVREIEGSVGYEW